jgi:curli biogenesis system outer membrane secretion channel CsgG
MTRVATSLASLLALSLIFISAARAEVVTTEATGIGRSRAEAITQALVEAVQRVTGVRVDQSAQTGLNQQVLQVDANANRSGPLSTINLDFSGTVKVSEGMDMVASQSGGTVKTYTVLSSSSDSRGYTTVRLKVDVEKFRSVMPETANRIRIVVAAFQGLPPDQTAQLQDRLKVYFVQARRFSVLDRSENPQYASEMAFVTSAAANLSERIRFGQVLGADFILVGKITITKRREEVLNPITMERSMRERASAEITYSLIEIATRQIQWSNIVKLASLESGYENVARLIGAQVSETLFPLRVVTSDDPANLTINQGGQSVVAGQRYRLVELGAEMTDPDTKESLGRRESDLGVVEITRVSQNVSSAKLISGNAKTSDNLILRRLDMEVKAAAPPTNSGTRSKAFD